MKRKITLNATFFGKYSYVFILLVIFIFLSIASPSFLKVDNLLNVIRQSSLLLIMSLGMSMAMILGRGVDMSIGAILSISSCFAAGFFRQNSGMSSIFLGIFIAMMIGMVAGLINGILIAYVRLPAMLVTFSTREILRGIVYFYMNGGVITSIHKSIRFLGSGRIVGIPVPIVIALALTILTEFFLKRCRIGRELFIVGANPEAARFSGVKVNKSIIIGFMCSGFMAAIAGVLYIGRLGAAEAEIGNEFAFQAVSAAAIGGISFNGGIGNPWGVVAGALILNLLINAQNLLGVSSSWQGTVNGIVIILAVLLDFFVRKQQTK